MKKILTVASISAAILFAFGMVSHRTSAGRAIFLNGGDDEREFAKQISLDILRHRATQRSIGNPDEYIVNRVEIDDLRMAHTRVQQTVDGVRVWEGGAIVHLKEDGSLSSLTDSLKDGIAIDTTPNLSVEDAVRRAQRIDRGSRLATEQPSADLYIYRGRERDHLAYRVELPRVEGTSQPAVPIIFIDAHTGEKLFQYDNLQTGSGNSLYGGVIPIDTSSFMGTYYMEDLTRRMGTFNMNSTGNEDTGGGGMQSRFTDTDDFWNSTIQRAGVDAHNGARWTYDYYKNVHGRNGIDGNGGPGVTIAGANGSIALITSRVHFGSSGAYNNAFWFNNRMSYGDGDGVLYSPLTTVDICGHEMTHGVIEWTALLTYANESGALNESMADVFGAMIELYSQGAVVSSNTWKIGEQAYTPATAGDAIRYLDNPHAASNGGLTPDDQPDHYSERYVGSADNGGVHVNSGIGNKAFYLLARGGTHHLSGVTMPGIGASDAARIWYRALIYYMAWDTNFAGARTATLLAANDLYGYSSFQYDQTATAWCAVGVGACPGELLVNNAFEGTASPWVGSGAAYNYISAGIYPHSATGYVYLGTLNSVSGQVYQQVTIPSSAPANLSFWLSVSSDETTTTIQYDKLFVEVRNTSGALLGTVATYSNLNKGPIGVYSQKFASLASWRGQTVRVQFRGTTDSILPTTFRVDDVFLK